MSRRFTPAFLLLTFCAVLVATSVNAEALRIGTFDSRVVALAYTNSPKSSPERQALMADIKKASDAGDKKRVEELKALGPSRQHLRHQQVFSNGSIIDIVPRFKDELPAIAKKHGLAMIVSKWELTYADPSAEYVDVTNDIVNLFGEPAEKVKKWIAGMEKVAPMPLQDLAFHPEH